MSVPTLAYPGLLLGPSTKYSSGHGTHTYDSNIYASLAGPVTTDKATATTGSVLPKLSVTRLSSTNPLPHVNSNVLCRVTRLQTRQVTTEILVVDGQVCQDSWAGVVRKEDVRGWEKDKVVMAESFQVGDLVRAVVISLGDQTNYYLNTAKNELGVLMATSEEGNTMVPISWKEFKDTTTGKTETRKVAKPL